jgi:hypothetical protein
MGGGMEGGSLPCGLKCGGGWLGVGAGSVG